MTEQRPKATEATSQTLQERQTGTFRGRQKGDKATAEAAGSGYSTAETETLAESKHRESDNI